jgi:hypothetical protein
MADSLVPVLRHERGTRKRNASRVGPHIVQISASEPLAWRRENVYNRAIS